MGLAMVVFQDLDYWESLFHKYYFLESNLCTVPEIWITADHFGVQLQIMASAESSL